MQSVKKKTYTQEISTKHSLNQVFFDPLGRKPFNEDFDKVATAPKGPGSREGTPGGLGARAKGFVFDKFSG